MPLSNPGFARLTATQIASIRPRSEEFDLVDPAVPGLILRVGPSGSKRWLFRFRWKRSRPRIALGEFPTLGLAEARDRALAHRKELSNGIDPRRSSRPQFQNASTTLQRKENGRWPETVRAMDTRSGKPVNDNSISIPQPESQDKQSAAIFSQMFTFGVHRSIISSSPVTLLFAPGGEEKSKTRVLSEDELYRFLHGLPYVCTTPVRRHTLMVLLLLLVRRGSLAQATWDEFNFETKEWSIPAEHDKERRAHIVPLTDWAIEELLALKALSKGSRYVLPQRRE
jgi:integrase